MNASDVDRFARRLLLRGGAAVGLAAARLNPVSASARKRRRKLKRNAFGCVSVGGKCRGKDSVCCSGICLGPAPKHGSKDTSRCVDHDTSDCAPGLLPCGNPEQEKECTTSSAVAGLCYTTTGNAAYCAKGGICLPCARDADCRPYCGPLAACVQCKACESKTVHTACVGISGCTPP